MKFQDLDNTYAASQTVILVVVSFCDLQVLMVAVDQASACASSPPSRECRGRSDPGEVEVTELEYRDHRKFRLSLF